LSHALRQARGFLAVAKNATSGVTRFVRLQVAGSGLISADMALSDAICASTGEGWVLVVQALIIAPPSNDQFNETGEIREDPGGRIIWSPTDRRGALAMPTAPFSAQVTSRQSLVKRLIMPYYSI
jgi:hypothetical protein